MNEPKNLWQIYDLYSEYVYATKDSKTAKNVINETKSAIMRFLISGFGYEKKPSGRKMTKEEIESASEFMKTLRVEQLKSANDALQRGFENLVVSKDSQNTYSARINQLLDWSKQQLWWPLEHKGRSHSRNKYCPKMRKGHGRVSNQKLTERSEVYTTYQLQPQEISPALEAELKEFYEYLTEREWPGRLTKPISNSSAQTYLKHIRLMLGWFYRYQSVPLTELNLNLLIPYVTHEHLEDLDEEQQEELWLEKKTALDTWLCQHFKFLREELSAFSPSTKKFKMNALTALAKFQYYREVTNVNDYAKIPVIKVLSKHSRAVRKEIKGWNHQKRNVGDQDLKWPNVIPGKTALYSVRQQILEPLRLECRFKTKNWHRRDGSAIAASLERYLVWSFLADMPARRQEEPRSYRIALCCPIERPADVPVDGLYHPLPPSDVRERDYDGSLQDNYLYKTYVFNNSHYPDGVWVLDTQDYKTDKSYGSQIVVIPNRRFADGTCLYDYIERYLYGWWMPGVGKVQQVYTWWQSHLKGQCGQWVTSGRAAFEPGDACVLSNQFWSWGYLFVKPLVGIPYKSSNYKDLVTTAAHRVSGKHITPHTMRYVWATWAYQVGLTDQQRESLAYAMGHDVKTMREMYERCTPDEKRRPIEEAIDEFLFKTLPSRKIQHSATVNLEELASELLQLPLLERQQLLQSLTQ